MELETLIKSLEAENSNLQQKAREQQDKCTEIEELKTKMKTAEVIISQYSNSLQSKNDKTSKLRDELEALKNEFKNMITTIRVLEIANRTYEEEIIELKGNNITHQGEQTKHESEAESKNNHKNPKNNKKQRKQSNNNNINKSNNNENKNNIDNGTDINEPNNITDNITATISVNTSSQKKHKILFLTDEYGKYLLPPSKTSSVRNFMCRLLLSQMLHLWTLPRGMMAAFLR
ncbi:unnamed protein product [Ceutorhynchus assimilis]|uniref:Uncharacterized protein n=1 Tax=Ceutorhynchus assimilis TaxID=467358 RepID=A0A9N9MEL6_9CUCU|nr:unnamed protein product [Ceutorhynchus assimilis]